MSLVYAVMIQSANSMCWEGKRSDVRLGFMWALQSEASHDYVMLNEQSQYYVCPIFIPSVA